MKGLDPVVVDGQWKVRLSRQGFGWHYVLGPASLPREQAIHLAYAKLEELRAARLAEPHAQLELQTGPPRTLAAAVDAWRAVKRVKRQASERYVKTYAARVIRDLGSYNLLQFVDGGGQERITAYLDRMLAAGAASRTVRNVLSTLKQVLRFSANPERRWIPFVPEFPRQPELPAPLYQWIDEPLFRHLRAQLYAPGVEWDALVSWLRRAGNRKLGSPELFVERRRVYLSWLFYTGVRNQDADHLSADDVSLDFGVYTRRAQKTSAEPMQFAMPEPLVDDLRAYLAAAGREFFLPKERIGGGRWANVARILQRKARELGIEVDVTPRIFRRSFAREMFVLGYEPREVAEMMGHVDLSMLQEIYVQTPRPKGPARSLWRRTVPGAHGGNVGPAKVLRFGLAPELQKTNDENRTNELS